MVALPYKLLVTTALLCVACLPLVSQEDTTKRIQFAKGRTSTTIRNSVVRGTRDRYLIDANSGQIMRVVITSLGKNAVFSLADPKGEFLRGAGEEDDATHWRGKLTASGDYSIVVGGTRGNAQYTLTVNVR